MKESRVLRVADTTEDIVFAIDTYDYDKGIKFTFCPFCGARLERQMDPMVTHDKIMTHWWRMGRGIWTRVKKYDATIPTGRYYQMTNGRYLGEWDFRGIPCATVPPKEHK